MFHIHELHHHVLRSWAKLKDFRPKVISFDHHTDILTAFLRYSEKNNNLLPANAGNNIEYDIELLRHDEHFDYAIKYNIISSAVIISHTPACTVPCENLHVLYDGNFSEDEPLNSEKYRRYFDMALEDSFLEKYLPFMPEKNYILDIDCDYFKTEKALRPEKSEIFRNLVKNADMITVSREDDWVKILTFENPAGFTPDYIIERLQQYIA